MGILEGSSILITEPTGSVGKALVSEVLRNHSPVLVAIHPRDQLKQYEKRQDVGDGPRERFFVRDFRARGHLRVAPHRLDCVIHATAIKRVDTAHCNPMEHGKTNALGSETVVIASVGARVQKVMALRPDKASVPAPSAVQPS